MLWSTSEPNLLSQRAVALLGDTRNTTFFSVASLREIGIKTALKRRDFSVDASLLRLALEREGHQELAISGNHAIVATSLPHLHKDPFDRMLIAQAAVEGLTLLTVDRIIAT